MTASDWPSTADEVEQLEAVAARLAASLGVTVEFARVGARTPGGENGIPMRNLPSGQISEPTGQRTLETRRALGWMTSTGMARRSDPRGHTSRLSRLSVTLNFHLLSRQPLDTKFPRDILSHVSAFMEVVHLFSQSASRWMACHR